jgi:hypothetical protein
MTSRRKSQAKRRTKRRARPHESHDKQTRERPDRRTDG